MRRIVYLLMLLGMFSCYEEADIHVDDLEARYNLEDDPSDPVQHYIYEFYQQYRTIILTNPTIYDYKFNFSQKNRIDITAPEQDKDLLYEGIQFIEDVFIDIYTPEFRKRYFPMLIIMADTIRDAGWGSTEQRNSVSSTNFVAIGNIRKGFVSSLTSDEIVKMRADINGSFWADYMMKAKGWYTVDSAFYKVSADDYGKVVVSVNRHFYQGKCDYFYISDNENFCHDCVISRIEERADAYIYELSIPCDIEIGKLLGE